MSYMVEKIAALLKAAREQKGMSQRELSALAGVPQSHISRIEQKEVDLRLSSLTAIAHALGLELMLVPIKAEPAIRSMTGLEGFVAQIAQRTYMQNQLNELHRKYSGQSELSDYAAPSQKPMWQLEDDDDNK